jgi:hypothetical protein
MLRTAYPAIRKALSEHLGEMSKKKALEKAGDAGTIGENRTPYRVDGEVGRFEFPTHSAFGEDGRIAFDASVGIFERLASKEYFRTVGFKELAYIHGDTEGSFRKTACLINRIRHQETGGTPSRTLRETTFREGEKVVDFQREKTRRCLIENGFDENGRPISFAAKEPEDDEGRESETAAVAEREIEIRTAAEGLSDRFDAERILSNPVPYEDPDRTVNSSIDDVNVKRQEEERPKGREPGERKRKYAHNTVCHVEKGESSYTLNAGTIGESLSFLLAFLLSNDLIARRLQFFTDGHRSLNEAILKFFSWHFDVAPVLDWYHLVKKCKELLSMALKGRFVVKRILVELMPLLWHGLTDDAIAYLRGIGDEDVKNREKLENLIEYLERNRPYIPCYALRKKLGLRNGSSIGEKMNDLIVSNRQKHNGMSWSKRGSVALASLTALKRNGEARKWFEENEIGWKLAA